MKPFVSFDGVDAQGVRAEVFVQVGSGVVIKIEGLEDESKRNVRVCIKSDHDAVKKPINGWLQRNDPLLAKVIEAKEAERTVNYRVESQRKSSVNRSLPIGPLRDSAEKAQENCISIFAGMDGQLSTEAVTNPAEDPSGGRVPATGSQPTPGAGAGPSAPDLETALKAVASARASNLPEGVLHAAMAQALAAGATVAQVQDAGFAGQGDQQQPQARSAFASEAPSFKAYNTDGRINLGSYIVQAMIGCERFAKGLIADAHAAEAPEGTTPEPVDLSQAAALAEVILKLADDVQIGAYGGGRVDRMAPSHTRARSLVFDAIEDRHPVPFGSDDDARQAWAEAIIREATERFRHLADLVMGDQSAPEATPAPQPQQVPAAQQSVEPTASVDEASCAKPGPVVEGQEGFVAPSPELLDRFASLAKNAGFVPEPDSPVLVYLKGRFGVNLARQVGAGTLDTLLSWYEVREDGPRLFHKHVTEAAAASAA